MILVRHGQSHFNVAYGATRQDPGLVDPGLTDDGIRQAEAAAEQLAERAIGCVMASPYSRTLHTAEIIARRLGLGVIIEPLIGERVAFTCDIGTPRSRLSPRWPGFDFSALAERWWPEGDETEVELLVRCTAFRTARVEAGDWRNMVVVSHWGFIRALTGQAVANGAVLAFNPLDGAYPAPRPG